MTTAMHYCLDAVQRSGFEFDCPRCRALMLEAFRAPAALLEQSAEQHPNDCPFCRTSTNPDLRDHIRNVHPEQFVSWAAHPSAAPADHPHLMIPPEAARTVPFPDRISDPFTDEQQAPPIAEHTTLHSTTPDDEGPGGLWRAACSCGWSETGHYARATGQPVADRLARLKAEQHRNHPETYGETP